MDGAVKPELSKWINQATEYVKKLDIKKLQEETSEKCCVDIEVGVVIDETWRELDKLIKQGQDISERADLRHVQDAIARSVFIDLLFDSNVDIRASILCTALTGKNRFLLILDSMWQGYSPSCIGILELIGGRKLIVTSRLHFVFNLMGKRWLFEIKASP
ncbi:hypothetical protein Ancab_004743 [Ancistrocladus abbreviatus]